MAARESTRVPSGWTGDACEREPGSEDSVC